MKRVVRKGSKKEQIWWLYHTKTTEVTEIAKLTGTDKAYIYRCIKEGINKGILQDKGLGVAKILTDREKKQAICEELLFQVDRRKLSEKYHVSRQYIDELYRNVFKSLRDVRDFDVESLRPRLSVREETLVLSYNGIQVILFTSVCSVKQAILSGSDIVLYTIQGIEKIDLKSVLTGTAAFKVELRGKADFYTNKAAEVMLSRFRGIDLVQKI